MSSRTRRWTVRIDSPSWVATARSVRPASSSPSTRRSTGDVRPSAARGRCSVRTSPRAVRRAASGVSNTSTSRSSRGLAWTSSAPRGALVQARRQHRQHGERPVDDEQPAGQGRRHPDLLTHRQRLVGVGQEAGAVDARPVRRARGSGRRAAPPAPPRRCRRSDTTRTPALTKASTSRSAPVCSWLNRWATACGPSRRRRRRRPCAPTTPRGRPRRAIPARARPGGAPAAGSPGASRAPRSAATRRSGRSPSLTGPRGPCSRARRAAAWPRRVTAGHGCDVLDAPGRTGDEQPVGRRLGGREAEALERHGHLLTSRGLGPCRPPARHSLWRVPAMTQVRHHNRWPGLAPSCLMGASADERACPMLGSTAPRRPRGARRSWVAAVAALCTAGLVGPVSTASAAAAPATARTQVGAPRPCTASP